MIINDVNKKMLHATRNFIFDNGWNFSTNQKTLFNILSKQKELVLKD